MDGSNLDGETHKGISEWYFKINDKNEKQYYWAGGVQELTGNSLSALIDFSALWKICENHPLKIGIYDTGVRNDTNLFLNKVIQLNPHGDSTIKNFHGTYMATIIAGNDTEDGYYGFLPNSQIFSYQAPLKEEKGKKEKKAEITPESLIKALKEFLKKDVDIVNISWATNNGVFKTNSQLKSILSECLQRGMIINAASGNEGIHSDNLLYYPAALQEIISVAGYKINGNQYKLNLGLNYWTGIKVLGPSFEIFDKIYYKKYSITASVGSSVACAVMSGIFGILKCIYKSQKLDSKIEFDKFILEKISLMPEVPVTSTNISTKAFKFLDFSTFNKLLNISV